MTEARQGGGDESEDHPIVVLPRGQDELRISRSRYKGATFTKIHLWIRSSDGKLYPSKRCTTIRDGELPAVLEALGKVAARIRRTAA